MSKLQVLGTSIRVEPAVLLNIAGLWGGISWLGARRHPERGVGPTALIGLGKMTMLLIADFGHSVAHIVSARFAEAPMDEVYVSAGMPRTLYDNNDVAPRAHIIRSLGGPIFSALGLLVSRAVVASTPKDTLTSELAAWSVIGHSVILIGSALPLPIVDAGVILKWTLVERGMSEEQADQFVQGLNWAFGVGGSGVGLALLTLGKRVPGAVVMGVSAAALGVAAGKIR
jgi:hypothetical protein